MGRVYRRPGARRDLIAHYVCLAENAGDAVADRFLDQVESSFTDLLSQPLMGALLALRNPELAGLRQWRVHGFDHFLIFYLPRGR